MSNYKIDVYYARATPSNQLLLDRIADEWVTMGNAAETTFDRRSCLAKAAYWRSVTGTAFPNYHLSVNHGL
jgi:hypothetical protein